MLQIPIKFKYHVSRTFIIRTSMTIMCIARYPGTTDFAFVSVWFSTKRVIQLNYLNFFFSSFTFMLTRDPPCLPPTTFLAPSFHTSGTANFPSFFSPIFIRLFPDIHSGHTIFNIKYTEKYVYIRIQRINMLYKYYGSNIINVWVR